MQIQYNITRIEEWCKSHEIPEGTLQLEHLMQATKLLQFKKGSLEDIENIYDVCWILSPTQIQKLISQYQTADYEVRSNPLHEQRRLNSIALSRIQSNLKSLVQLLPMLSAATRVMFFYWILSPWMIQLTHSRFLCLVSQKYNAICQLG